MSNYQVTNRLARHLLRRFKEDEILKRLARYPEEDRKKLNCALVRQREYLLLLTPEQRRAKKKSDDLESRCELIGKVANAQ